jgi:hypothetical protein
MTTEDLLNELKEYTTEETVHMYIIERKLRLDKKLKDSPSVKFEYIPLQVDVSEDLAPVISAMLTRAIEKKFREDIEITNYEVIDDTIERIYTYKDLDRIAGFKDFLNTRLGGEINALKSFEELKSLEKAWALCYGFYNKRKRKWLYCIKKLAPSKMAVEIETSTSVAEAIKHGLTSYFDMKTKTLKPFNGFSLSLEPNIDMIYFDEEIYILQKRAFEDITSLTEEFETLAYELITELDEIKFIDGIHHLTDTISKKPAFRNKLIKAKSIGNLDFLKTCGNIKKEFQRAGKKLEIKFSFDGAGNIISNSTEEAENIIKVLSEFYKEGIFGGKIFESPAGRIKK